ATGERQQPDGHRPEHDEEEVEEEGRQAVSSRRHDERERQPLRRRHRVDPRFLQRDRGHRSRPTARKYQVQKASVRAASDQRTPTSWTSWRKNPSINPATRNMTTAPTAR